MFGSFASSFLLPPKGRIARQRQLLVGGCTTNSLSQWFSSGSLWDSYGDPAIREELPEVQAAHRLTEFLKRKTLETAGAANSASHSDQGTIIRTSHSYPCFPSRDDCIVSLEASMATLALHVHARIASSVGKGYYTIGPCGEESLAPVGTLLEPEDSSALHYRHTAISLARQLKASRNKALVNDDDVLCELLLGRARGYTTSKLDPVTGGVHCCIGGGTNEFVVTSTLASQCPSAVGRALGYSLVRKSERTQKRKEPGTKEDDDLLHRQNRSRPVSLVTIGDGSLHNHHFLSSWTLAKHARHRSTKCPVVFGISDNGFSISYRTQGFTDAFFAAHSEIDPLCPVFRVDDASDPLRVYEVTRRALQHSRKQQGPSVVLYQNLARRFGHAATDRQLAYMDAEEIQEHQSRCAVEISCVQAVEALGFTTYGELLKRWTFIQEQTEIAFGTAIQEPRVTLTEMMDRVSVPLAPMPSSVAIAPSPNGNETSATSETPKVLRKHMTRALSEAMKEDESVVYLGEDVRHGGYYLVTDGLTERYPDRVFDFPPDETTLLGAALGFAQLGMTPIVEIPYAKYLDCGADLFHEIAIQHWLTHGQQHSGMVIRLQGFDRGVFGGNFHTHNGLTHVPPGIDLVCFSNGTDWVKGFRHAVWQAKYGRIVVVVDPTRLLTQRHLHESEKDRAWECNYPEASNNGRRSMVGFETVIRYSGCRNEGENIDLPFTREEINGKESCAGVVSSHIENQSNGKIAIVTYGNGVIVSLQARKALVDRQLIDTENDIDVIDCPYLCDVPRGLEMILAPAENRSTSFGYEHVLFADCCKEGPGSNVFSSTITSLQQSRLLPESWAFVGAPRTYNPLGSTVTFLNPNRIESAVIEMAGLGDGNNDDSR